MKISVFEVEDWERQRLTDLEENHDVRFESATLDARTIEDHTDAEVLCTFLYSDLRGEILARCPDLRLVVSRSAGVDHVDVGWCEDHDVTVTNVPGYGDQTVAEHVFALLLTISHRMVEAVDRTRKGDFSLTGLRGFDLCGRTMGVLGTGGIGRHVIPIARAFGMTVVANDVAPDEAVADELGFRYVELGQLLRMADVVTVHVPGGSSTRHLLGADEFAAMKQGSVLINTARGDVVDSQALLRALVEGRVAAAGLDVLEAERVVREEAELLRAMSEPEPDTETFLHGHILLRMRNVVVTPHSAFDTEEAVQRILHTTVGNIESFARGSPQNTVAR